MVNAGLARAMVGQTLSRGIGMPVRAVFFDFGGTLFSYGTMREQVAALIEETARRHGATQSAREIRHTYFITMLRQLAAYENRPYYLHRDLFGEAIEGLIRALGFEPSAGLRDRYYDEQTALALSLAQVRPEALETLRGLRDAGVHVGIVSNIDDDQFGPLWEKIGLDDVVDAKTTSEGARSCKPYPEIYRHALRKAGDVAAQDCVFVGDSVPHDVAGANALGMTSVLISNQPLEPGAKATPHHVIEDLRPLLEIARR